MKTTFILIGWLLGVMTLPVHAQTFMDNFANESIGNLASQWEPVKGSAVIGELDGQKVLSVDRYIVVKPVVNGQTTDYLGNQFTIEFDAFFYDVASPNRQYYIIHLWDGTGVYGKNDKHTDPYLIYRHGITATGSYINRKKIESLAQLEKTWRHIKITYAQNTLKFFIDDHLIHNQPDLFYDPLMVSFSARNSSGVSGGIANVSITDQVVGIEQPIEEETTEDDTEDGATNDQNLPYSFPVQDGEANQILQTDGNGTLNWVDYAVSDSINKRVGLEEIDKKNGLQAWRITNSGTNARGYGTIGINAVDLSIPHGPGYDDPEKNQAGAMGYHSFAAGWGALALGPSSVAIKGRATAQNSMAFGGEASEDFSMALKGKASGWYSVSIGSKSLASGNYSTAISGGEASKLDAIAIGGIASGEKAIAIGYNSVAQGDYSKIFVGEASGDFSMALMGTASGHNSVSIGGSALASGDDSKAFGSEVRALGKASTAFGVRTEALGTESIAFGADAKAESYRSFVLGTFNLGGGHPEEWKGIDPLFEIGNGEDEDNPSNALTVLKNGNIGIGTHTPQAKLHIQNGTDANNSKGGYLIIGDKKKENIVFDNNEIIARNNVQPAILYLQSDGGDVYVGRAVVHSSDKRLKQDIENLSYGLNEVLQLRPVSYHWKTNPNASNKSLGLIAQEVQPILKELITVNTNNDDNTLGVNYTELIPILIKAIQEQQTIIENQNKKIDNLSSSYSDKELALSNLTERMKLVETLLNIDKL